MENVYDVCRWRGISDDIIEKLKKDKIDENAISVMSDQQLSQYIPHVGDRLCIQDFCNNRSSAATGTNERKSVPPTLFHKLKQRVSHTGSARIRTQTVSKATKADVDEGTKVINFGLKRYGYDKTLREFHYIQVKTDHGGGTRKSITMDKSSTKADLIKRAQELFFHPKTVLGSVDKFDHDLTDFAGSELEDGVTLGKFYDVTRIRDIRFYLCIKAKGFDSTELDDASDKKKRTKKRKRDETIDLSDSDNDLDSGNSSNPVKTQCTRRSADSPGKGLTLSMCGKCGRRFAGKSCIFCEFDILKRSLDELPSIRHVPRTQLTSSTRTQRQSANTRAETVIRPICDNCSRTRSIGQDCEFCENQAAFEESLLMDEAKAASLAQIQGTDTSKQLTSSPPSTINNSVVVSTRNYIAPSRQQSSQSTVVINQNSSEQKSTTQATFGDINVKFRYPSGEVGQLGFSRDALFKDVVQCVRHQLQTNNFLELSLNNVKLHSEHNLDKTLTELSITNHSTWNVALLERNDANSANNEASTDTASSESITDDNNVVDVLSTSGDSLPAPFEDEDYFRNDGDTTSRWVTVNRTTIVEDLLRIFREEDGILNQNVTVKCQVVNEKAIDQGGVFRDLLTQFWNTIMDVYFDGTAQCSPLIFPDFSDEEFATLGDILFKGFQQLKYFPVRFAKACVLAGLFGPNSVPDEILLDSFLLSLACNEMGTLKVALVTKSFSKDDTDTIVDILKRFNLSKNPTPETLKDVLIRCAKTRLIQVPHFLLASMNLDRLKVFDEFKSAIAVHKFYLQLQPSINKLLDMVDLETGTKEQATALEYLRRSIRNFQTDHMAKFLRFVTGSDCVLVEKIDIQFNGELKGVKRRFVAHTCTATLEVPLSFISFNEFDSALRMQLLAGDWVMDLS